MNPIYLRLFDGYAADILQKADPFDSKSVDQLADSLSLGLHLGLSLVHDNVRRGGPQQV